MQTHDTHELVVAAQISAKPPAHMGDVALETADISMGVLRHFATKYQLSLEQVVRRFIEINPDLLDEDKSIVLQREQAKISVEIMKAAQPKEIEHKGNINHQVTKIERRIIDA